VWGGGLRDIQNAVSGFAPAGLRRATSSVSAGEGKKTPSSNTSQKPTAPQNSANRSVHDSSEKLGQQWEVTKYTGALRYDVTAALRMGVASLKKSS